MSDTPNLDAAIAAAGPKTTFIPTFTTESVAPREEQQLAEIATIKPPKDRVLEVADAIEASLNNPGLQGAAGLAFGPGAVGAMKGSAMGMELLENIFLKRGKIEIKPEDITEALNVFQMFKKTEPSSESPTQPVAAPSASSSGATSTPASATAHHPHTPHAPSPEHHHPTTNPHHSGDGHH